MNDQLSFQSSALCQDVATSTLTAVQVSPFDRADGYSLPKVTDMASQTMVSKKLMLLMALCLVFATAVPVIVLAAG